VVMPDPIAVMRPFCTTMVWFADGGAGGGDR
jgi:hypothetical protein